MMLTSTKINLPKFNPPPVFQKKSCKGFLSSLNLFNVERSEPEGGVRDKSSQNCLVILDHPRRKNFYDTRHCLIDFLKNNKGHLRFSPFQKLHKETQGKFTFFVP
jgi:hypothetical protein